MNEHRPGSDPQTEHRGLARPLGRSIAQTRDADPARQSPLDGSLHEFGREEGERDCHIDLPKAAFVPRGNLLDSGDGAGNDLSKPMSAAPATTTAPPWPCSRRGRDPEARVMPGTVTLPLCSRTNAGPFRIMLLLV